MCRGKKRHPTDNFLQILGGGKKEVHRRAAGGKRKQGFHSSFCGEGIIERRKGKDILQSTMKGEGTNLSSLNNNKKRRRKPRGGYTGKEKGDDRKVSLRTVKKRKDIVFGGKRSAACLKDRRKRGEKKDLTALSVVGGKGKN